ncbi:MAG: DNA translocase FtsK [Clostridia bacterium]|nr:DNA translocase FtsK [Clostridia bacterium]
MEDITYKFPSNGVLIKNNKESKEDNDIEKKKIEIFFRNYKIDIDCKDVHTAINSITYIIDLKCKTKVSTIKSFKDDLMMMFNAIDIEFQIAINGTAYLGIHLIKHKNKILMLGDLIQEEEFVASQKKIPIIIGKDFNDKIVIEDLTQLPHLLIAGTTGTGKSNFLSTIIVDIIYKLRPDEVKLVLVDTRITNFKRFNTLPHLLIPVITESQKAIGMLAYLIQEMINRYKLFEDKKVDNIDSYNKISEEKLPRIIIIIEDFYDLMMDTEKEIEIYIQKLINICRESGINIIISTQRPSTNVITGVIKVNISARIAFKVPSQIDSKTIIDIAGAEELLIYGDILFSKVSECKVKRVQVPYISDIEIKDIINEIETINKAKLLSSIDNDNYNNFDKNCDIEDEEDDTDLFLEDAIETVIETGQASASFIQRKFDIGYARAGRIIDQMEKRKIISGYEGSKPRKVLITLEKWKRLKNKEEK